MSGAPEIRNSKFALDDAQARALLARGYCGRLATVSADGSPYVVPLLYVLLEGQVYAHNSRGGICAKTSSTTHASASR